jgi:regulator of chromosome condensation
MGVRRATATTQITTTSRKRSLPDDTHPPPKRVKAPAATAANPLSKKDGRGAKSPTQKPSLNAVPTTRLGVFVFGDGSAGELGLGNKDAVEVESPRLNYNLDPKSVGVVSLAAGGMHAVALTHNNKILTWGVNDLSALGRDTTWEGRMRDINGDKDSDSDESEPDLNPQESNPAAISADKFPAGTRFVQVAAGDSATFALTDDGFVYGWGTFRVSLAFIKIHIIEPTASYRIAEASLVST